MCSSKRFWLWPGSVLWITFLVLIILWCDNRLLVIKISIEQRFFGLRPEIERERKVGFAFECFCFKTTKFGMVAGGG